MSTTVNAVLAWLMKNPGPHGPTEIGLALGLPYISASSGVMSCLRSLEKMGAVRRVMVKRSPKAKGTAAYEWTGIKPKGVYMG